MKYKYKNPVKNGFDGIDCLIILDGEWVPTTQDTAFEYALSDSIGADDWVDIKPYIKPVKSLEQLQNEALAAIQVIVLAECRSGEGILYFSDMDSASRYDKPRFEASKPKQYARAQQLIDWDTAIDDYCDGVLFGIKEGGAIPDLDSFIAGLPKL